MQCSEILLSICMTYLFLCLLSDVVFEKAYCEYRLNRVENALKTIEAAPEQTDKLKELYGQVVRLKLQTKQKQQFLWMYLPALPSSDLLLSTTRLCLMWRRWRVPSIAQLYRMERYDDCKSVYTDLIRNSQDEYEEERKTNLAAVVASMSQWEEAPLVGFRAGSTFWALFTVLGFMFLS